MTTENLQTQINRSEEIIRGNYRDLLNQAHKMGEDAIRAAEDIKKKRILASLVFIIIGFSMVLTPIFGMGILMIVVGGILTYVVYTTEGDRVQAVKNAYSELDTVLRNSMNI